MAYRQPTSSMMLSSQFDVKKYNELENNKLNELADIVSGLKTTAQHIGGLVDESHEIINGIDTNVADASDSIENNTKQVKKIINKKCCGEMTYCYIIGIIQIVIIIFILCSWIK